MPGLGAPSLYEEEIHTRYHILKKNIFYQIQPEEGKSDSRRVKLWNTSSRRINTLQFQTQQVVARLVCTFINHENVKKNFLFPKYS